MNENDRINLDLDMRRMADYAYHKDNEAVFYFRVFDKHATQSFGGSNDNIVNGLVSMMIEHEGMYDLMASALDFFEENSFECQACKNLVFHTHSVVCPFCGAKV